MIRVAAILCILCSPAMAANCGPRDAVVKSLKTKYGERFVAGGLQKTRSAQSILEVWASDETGTFTVILSSPNGLSCVVAAGTDFFEGPPLLSQPKGNQI
ncbi:hypothetical protein KX928_23395 [Roseobacter sp. YSTF-M11]|uniref:Lipoprotein n=1 Tax=Roseobacter insulae TaxID=2859783 RepID=A0A9X1K0N3_9RHOB|nr:hypothetical protein [Roseobacter insulae]MBW4710746.1 hypothetical protein [Roseobacter insulae]